MWNASNLQVVWFAVDASGISASSVYEAVTGTEADGFEKNRVPNPKNPFLSRAYGVKDNKTNRVQVGPGRVDWFIEPYLRDGDHPYENLLDTRAMLEAIRGKITGIDDDLIGDATRASIVVNLIQPFNSADDASEWLVKICGIPIEPNGLLDASVQANRRKEIKGGLQINRLMRLSMETISFLVVNVNQHPGVALSSAPENEERNAVRVSLDFNTVPTGKVFGAAQQKDIFTELIDETLAASEAPSIDFLKD